MDQEARTRLVNILNMMQNCQAQEELAQAADQACEIIAQWGEKWDDLIISANSVAATPDRRVTEMKDPHGSKTFEAPIWKSFTETGSVTFSAGTLLARAAYMVDELGEPRVFEQLNAWEKDFVVSQAERLSKRMELSEKQFDKLEGIYKKEIANVS